jgi:hypothetical protein
MACKHWQEGPRDAPPAAFSSDGLTDNINNNKGKGQGAGWLLVMTGNW